VLQLSFAAGDGVDLNALYKHLNQGSAFCEFSPGQGQAVQSNRALLLGEAANHHFQNADSKRVDIL